MHRLFVASWGVLATLLVTEPLRSGIQWDDLKSRIVKGAYTLDQARRSEHLYRQECRLCHLDDLRSHAIDGGLLLRGPKFATKETIMRLPVSGVTLEETSESLSHF